MPKGDVNNMHQDFPRWYRVVSIEDDLDRVQRRWVGVSALVASATRAEIEAMIRLAFRTKQVPIPSALARVRQEFKSADELFDMQGNDRELEILCGATLAVLFERGGDRGATAALAMTTTALDGARAPVTPMDLVALAEHTIAHVSETHRKRPDLESQMKKEGPKFDFDKAAAKVKEQPNAEGFASAFALAAEATRAALAQVTQRMAGAVSAAGRFIAIQDEELEMLWWLVGGRSWDLDRDFTAVATAAQPLVLAKELASSTQALPGPLSVKALLSRAGLKENTTLAIPVAVNACDDGWLRGLLQGVNVSPVSLPIHFAIQRKLETGDATSWLAGWAAAADVGVDHAVSPLSLGNLFYRERLLAILGEDA